MAKKKPVQAIRKNPKDKYYGPEKYKGYIGKDAANKKSKNYTGISKKKLKEYRKKYKGNYIGPDIYKGKKRKKPKTNPPAPPTAAVVKTVKPPAFVVKDLTRYIDQSREILEAYLSMAGTELYQYLNTESIDGAYNDVAIINVLSRRRQAYTPNRIIELERTYVKSVWIADGKLYIDIMDSDEWDEAVLYVKVLEDETSIARTVN